MNKIPNAKLFAELPHSFAIQLKGADAAKVINNLSTNDIGKLAVDASCETLITDARGWVVAHTGVIKGEDEAWLVGSHSEPSRIANHLDRYIIREAALVNDRSAEFALFVIHEDAVHNILDQDGSSALRCPLPIWGPSTILVCWPRERTNELIEKLHAQEYVQCDDAHFQWLRVSSFWPLQTADIGDKTIPQELDRDQQAISFTKGCYLGQETIARLDARGQLQKKLCLVELDPVGQYAVGDALHNAEKEVGKITSLARDPDSSRVRVLAYLRRGNFDSGTQLNCNGLTAIVAR